MSVNTIHALFHLSVFAISFFAAYYGFFHVRYGHQGFPGKFRFLTFWNICFQTVYFGLCVVLDLAGAKSASANPAQRGTLQKWRDTFHACVVFPTSTFVFTTFWVIYSWDRELVQPKVADSVLPVWLNHLMHTTILPFIVVEKFLSYHHYPRRSMGFLAVSLLASAYLSTVLLVAYFDDYWIYPILRVLSLSQRAVFISASFVIFAIFYIVGEYFTSYIWGQGLSSPKKTPKTLKGA